MKITVKGEYVYLESRMPRACFGHGDRECYVLSSESIEMLNDKYNINLWSEYDVTINFFKDGTVNLMKMHYNNYEEEFQEEEIYVFSETEKNNIKIVYD